MFSTSYKSANTDLESYPSTGGRYEKKSRIYKVHNTLMSIVKNRFQFWQYFALNAEPTAHALCY